MSEAGVKAEGLTGRTLGDFIVRDKLGEGGFGAVYRAEQPALGREAVIKVLHAQHRSDDRVIQRFLREARLASKLDHPYAAHTYAFGAEPDGLLWIAMERVRGTPLDGLLKTWGRMSLERFAPLLDMLCEVLQTAHQQGIVHRDVKPANVMVLSRAGRMMPKLLDFGIAKTIDGTAAPASAAPPADLEASAPDLGATLRGDELAQTMAGSESARGLTQVGAVIGSPPYMAPEQWANGTIGPPTDLYALGAMTYEALTGTLPFPGRSLLVVARAHATKPVPSLGDAFPPRLDEVLRKAMAKRAEDRYQNALELAAAFREAAGLVADAATLPRLDDATREAALLDAPQPIADAVAALEAATSARHALDATDELVAIAARLVGLVALAARSQLGVPSGDAPAVDETLRILRRRTLADREWVELARALTRAFRARRDAYPLPELVALLEHDVADPFAPLLDLADERRTARGGEAVARGQLERVVPLVGRLLGALSFLSDYPLVVASGGVATRWSGIRRGKRPSMVIDKPIGDGKPALVSREGRPVLSLWPLVQADEPTPGAPEELFLFDGQGRHGARMVARPAGFVRRDDTIWEWFRTALPLGSDEREAQAIETTAPFPGLAAFTTADAALFFGREREVAAVVNRLRLQAFVAVVGPSGAGKSSFVHAGVVPNLPDGWRAISTRPGPSPLAALAAELTHAGVAIEPARLRAEPGALAAALAPLGATCLVLIVDQFEEAFTLCADPAERQAFFAALAAAARSPEDPLRVLLTLRDDFLMRAEREPTLRQALARGLQLIGTPTRDELERILVEPARRAGYEFEDRALPSEMVAAAADQAGALPLLSFTAAQMWELRDRHFKQLTRKVYAALGGVGGAIAQHAEQTIADLSGEEQRLLRDAFRHLVTADGTRAALSRAELLRVMGGGEVATLVAEKLIRSRLLILSDGTEGTDRVEIIHEALLSSWPRLVRWRQEDAEGARLRDQLRAAARQWDERDRPEGLLWRGEALAELQLWIGRNHAPLPSSDQAFADRSAGAARRSRNRGRIALVAVFVLLAATAAGFFQLSRRARSSEREARARVAELYEDQGRQALLDEDPERALVYLAEAMRGGRDGVPLRYLLARALAAIAPLDRVIFAHKGGINRVSYSADRQRLLTSGRDGASLWDPHDGRRLRQLSSGDALYGAVFVDGDTGVLSAAIDGTVRVHDTQSGSLRRNVPVFPAYSDDVFVGAIGPTARQAYVAFDDQIAIVDTRTLATLRTLSLGGPIAGLIGTPTIGVAHDGTILVVGDKRGDLVAWSIASGARTLTMKLDTQISRVLLDRTARRAFVATASGAVVVVDTHTGARTTLSIGRGVAAQALALSQDERALAIGYDDGTLQIFALDETKLRWSMAAHRAPIVSVALSPDGTSLLSGSADGSASLWDARAGLRLGYLTGHHGNVFIASYDGIEALTFSSDGNLRTWHTAPLNARAEFPEPNDINRLVIGRDRQTLYVGCADGSVTAWSLASSKRLYERRLGVPAPTALTIASDGSFVIAVDAPAAALKMFRLPSFEPGWSAPVGAAGVEWLQLSPGDDALLTGDREGRVRTWEVAHGRPTHTMQGPPGYVWGLAASRDGGVVASGGADTQIVLWDVARERELRRLSGHAAAISSLAFDADARYLLSASDDRTAKLWDAASGEPLITFEGHRASLMNAAFSPDTELIATVALDGTARIWSRTSGRLLGELTADRGQLYSVAFEADGRHVVTGGQDHVVRRWDTSTSTLTSAELDGLVRCRVGLRIENGRLRSVPLDVAGCSKP